MFEAFVADCPLRYTSPTRPKARDVLGTAMLSIFSGHTRYAHIAALCGDGVVPELLGMKKIVSEDAVRRAFAAIEEEAGAAWLRRISTIARRRFWPSRRFCDMDATVKPLNGRQEGAVVGLQPLKSLNSKVYEGLQSLRNMRRMDAKRRNTRAARLRFSQSLANLRQRLSQAMVRSTIQRLGSVTKPFV